MQPDHKLDIIHRDPHLVVVNRQGGLLSVPDPGPDKQDCIVGDSLYGKAKEADRLMHHAVFHSFFHPATGEKIASPRRLPF